MTREDFRKNVEEAAAHMAPISRAKALKCFEAQGNTERWHVPGCVELAGDFEETLQIAPQTDGTESFGSDSATSLTSAKLVEAITPEVERVRAELFPVTGAVTPPFSSCSDAVEWLAGLTVRGERSADDLTRAQRLHAEWLADPRRHEFEQIRGVQLVVTPTAHLIPYVAAGGTHVSHAPVSHGSPFVALETVSKRLADITGFHAARIVMHILCDSPLALPSIRTTKVLVGSRRFFRVEFNSPDVTKAQMMELLRRVRDYWGRAGGRRLNEKDEEFLAVIAELGGVPDSGTKVFFERVSEVCMARKIGSYKKSGWRGPYKRYRGLMKLDVTPRTKED